MESNIQRVLWGTLVASLLAVSVAYFNSRGAPPVLSQLHDFSLTNQLGQSVGKDSLKGRISVVNIVFTRCPTQCRRLSAQMQRLQSRIPSGVRLISLTADPEFDTPEVLKRYGLEYQASPETWWMLTGQKSEVYRVAIADLKFAVVESGEPSAKLEDLFIHTGDLLSTAKIRMPKIRSSGRSSVSKAFYEPIPPFPAAGQRLSQWLGGYSFGGRTDTYQGRSS